MESPQVSYSQRVSKLAIVLICLIAASSRPPAAGAQELWDGPSFSVDPAAALIALQSLPIKGNPDTVGLLEEENVSFTADGRCRRTNHEIYWIRSQEVALASSTVSVAWRPWYQKRPTLEARVITPDGTVHVLDPATIEDKSVGDPSLDLFSDRHLLRAPLPAIGAGSLVEFKAVLEDTAPGFAAGTAVRKYLPRSGPIRRTVVEIEYPASLELKFKTYFLPDVTVQKTESGGRIQLRFEQGPTEAVEEPEPMAPDEGAYGARIEYSTGVSWNTIATAYAKIIDDQISAADLKLIVGGITTGKTTPTDVAEALLQYVHQQIRYTGVEFGESALIPHTPKEVLKNKYGDCKDQAALLVGLLRQAGIPAYVTLLSAAPSENISRETPGMGLFNHAIVYAPGPPQLWIDVSAEFWRVGDLPEADQGRLALVISPKTDDLITTPEATAEANRVLETREVYLGEFGPSRVVETTQAWGSPEANLRIRYAAESDPEKLKKKAEEHAKELYVSDSVTERSTSDPHDLTKRFSARMEIGKVKQAVTDLDGAFVVLGPVQITDLLPEIFWQRESSAKAQNKKIRTSDLLLPMSYVYEVQYRIQAPPGFRPSSIPGDTEKHLGPSLLTSRYITDEHGVVTATIRFDTVKRRLTPTEAEQLESGVREFLSSDAPIVKFEHIGQAELEAGNIQGAVREFKSLIKLHPSEALHHVQLANALLAAGLGEAAREEAKLATKLEPKSALAYKTLAWILQHDLVGRRFGKGFDRDAALSAYQNAAILDPKDAAIAIDHAILLEHNGKGERYGDGSNLRDAADIYKSVEDELDRYQARENLFYALMWAHNFGELQKQLKAVPSTADRNALALVCVAALQGAPAAIKQAKLLGLDQHAGREALAKSAEFLLQLRMYSEAADLLTASAQGKQGSAAILARADLLRHIHHYEELQVKDSDPRSLVFRLLRAVLLGDVPEYLELYSHYAFREEDRKELTDTMRKAQRSIYRGLGGSQIARDVVLDLSLSMIDVNVQGNDQIGYTVRMQSAPDKPQVLFLIKEDARYKLVATAGPDDPVGINVAAGFLLELLRKGDISAARIWLDRLRAETAAGGGEDPLSGPLLTRFWDKGTPNGNASAVKYATAALMAVSSFSRESIPILLDGRSKATSQTEAANFDIALLSAYGQSKQYLEMLPVTERLVTNYPRSDIAVGLHVFVLVQLERFADAQRFLQGRLEQSPENPELLRLTASAATAQGQFQDAIQSYAKIIASGKASASDYNNLAWNYLIAGDASKSALDAGERAALLTERKAGYVLHTVACLYAEVGRTLEARDLLLKDMELEDMEEPDSNVWYGFGRIAEQYGFPDAAQAAYRRVEMPSEKVRLPDSTYILAQRRMRALETSTASR